MSGVPARVGAGEFTDEFQWHCPQELADLVPSLGPHQPRMPAHRDQGAIVTLSVAPDLSPDRPACHTFVRH